MCVASHAQIPKNNKSDNSLIYLKKKLGDQVQFLLADNNETFLEVDSFCREWSSIPKVPKITSCNVFTI